MYTVSRLVAFGSFVHALVFALALQVALRGGGETGNQSGVWEEDGEGGLMKMMIQNEWVQSGEGVRGGVAGILDVYADVRQSILSVMGMDNEDGALAAAPRTSPLGNDGARRGTNEHHPPRPQRGGRGGRAAVSHHTEETERGLLHKLLLSTQRPDKRPTTGDGRGREKNTATADDTAPLLRSRRSTSPPTSSGSTQKPTGASRVASTMAVNWRTTTWIMSSVLSSNVKTALALNVLFPLLLLFLVLVKESFFGNITAKEMTHAVECAARHHVMAFLTIACLYSESASTELAEVFLWISFFGVLAVPKIIACMGKDRFDTLSNYSDDKISERVVIVALLSGVIVCCWYVVLSVLATVLAFGGNPLYALVMVMQPLIVIVDCSHSLSKYVLHLHETAARQRQHREDEEQHAYCTPVTFGAKSDHAHLLSDDVDGSRGTSAAAAFASSQKSVALMVVLDREWYSYLSSTADLVADVLILPLSLVNILVVWYIHGLNLQILDGLLLWKVKRLAHTILVKLFSWYASRRTLVHLQSQFPAATASELGEYADECAICKDQMCSGRVLHCGHIFHLTCLRRWAAMGARANSLSCPICRATFPVHGKKRPRGHMHFVPAATTAAYHTARGGGGHGGVYQQRRHQRARQHEQRLERRPSRGGRGGGISSGESRNSSTSAVDSVSADEEMANPSPNVHAVPRRWYTAMPHSLRRRGNSSGVGDSGSSDAAVLLHDDTHDDDTDAESIEPATRRRHVRENAGGEHARGLVTMPPRHHHSMATSSSLWEWGWTRSAEMWNSRIAVNVVVSRDV